MVVVLEISAYCWLALVLLACSQAHDGTPWELVARAGERRSRSGEFPSLPSGHAPSDPAAFYKAQVHKGSTTSRWTFKACFQTIAQR